MTANIAARTLKDALSAANPPAPAADQDEISELTESIERMRISLKAVSERLCARSAV
jgi:HAMP domain-containing protein